MCHEQKNIGIMVRKGSNMKEFSYKICDELGIHARPAGLLVKEASKFSSEITMYKGEKQADMKRLFAVMSLAVKKGDTVRVTILGDDEEKACGEMEKVFRDNL